MQLSSSFLENHPKISWIKYPGLESHPQFGLAKSQMNGPGSMISFGVKADWMQLRNLWITFI